MLAAFPSLATVRLWDRTSARADRLRSQLRASGRGGALSVHPTALDAVASADAIVTTTASRAPLLGIADIAAGSHVNAMGADTAGKRELDPELIERCVLVVDDRDQSRQLGESQDPVVWREPTAGIGEVLLGMRPGRRSPDDVTVFDSTGIGLQDVSAADLVYREAVRLGRGTLLPWTRI